MAIALVTCRRDVMLQLAQHWTIVTALNDLFGLHVIQTVLDELQLPRDDFEIWQPVVSDLPAEISRFWRSTKTDGTWQEHIGQFIDRCTTIELSGPFARLVEHHHGFDLPWDR